MEAKHNGQRPYIVIDYSDGFLIVGEEDAVRVRLRPTHWVLERTGDSFDIPLFAFGLVLASVVCMLGSRRYRLLLGLDADDRGKAELAWSIKREQHRLPKELRPRVYRRLRQLLVRMDPITLAIQRAVSSSLADDLSGGAQGDAFKARIPPSDLIRGADVHWNILTHRAAAIAAGNLPELVDRWLGKVVGDFHGMPAALLDDPVRRSEIAARHPLFAHEDGIELLRRWMGDRHLPMSAALTAPLRFWPDLFAESGVSGPSLRRTLEALPDEVPDFLVCALRHVRLRRPITDLLELLVATLVGRFRGSSPPSDAAPACSAEVLLDARHGEVVRAMHLVSTHLGWTLEPRYVGHVETFVDFVLGHAETQRDSVVGLAEQAIADDLRALEQQRSEVVATLGASTPSARPPIPLPEVSGIRFLATVGEIADLGVETRSGLARFAEQAVKGDLYLFHVRHGRDDEVVLVSAGGWVQLPKYSDRSMTWSEKTLQAWADDFRPLATTGIEGSLV